MVDKTWLQTCNKARGVYSVSPAFKSLLFKRSYKNEFVRKRVEKPVRAPTYGGILCVETASGKKKYALVQGRYTGKWSFPKGHSNEGEEPLVCTLREIAEETGIDELPAPKEYVEVGYGKYYIFKLAEQVALIPRDKNEIMDTKWSTLEEMETLQLNADASLYRKYLESQTG